MKKRIALCVTAAVVVLVAAVYIFFYFNGAAAAVWKLGFSSSDIVTSFNIEDWNYGGKIILLCSDKRIGLLKLDRNVLGIWNKSSTSYPTSVVEKADKKNRYAVAFYEVDSTHSGIPSITSHVLFAGTSRKSWHLERLKSPKDSSFKLHIKCFSASGGQLFLADASSDKGVNDELVKAYIEQYEKAHSAN